LIFAKLDVSVYAHRRFAEAGFEAVGYWALVLAYLRHQESEDGFLPSQLIGVPLGAGRERCRPLCERLVSVGLFRKVEGGYFLVNYAEKNDTTDPIKLRVRATRERKTSDRQSTTSRGSARGAVTRHSGVTLPGSLDLAESPRSVAPTNEEAR
jgi:hypothetical protein